MPINRNIGKLSNAIDYALKVPDLINIDPTPDPYVQFTGYNEVRIANVEDPRSNGYFIWGLHKWGTSTNVVAREYSGQP